MELQEVQSETVLHIYCAFDECLRKDIESPDVRRATSLVVKDVENFFWPNDLNLESLTPNLKYVVVKNSGLAELRDPMLTNNVLILAVSNCLLGQSGANLPERLGTLQHLTNLMLQGNKLLDIQFQELNAAARKHAGFFVALTSLNLANNRITSFPECFSSLTTLKVLDLQGNNLTSLPVRLFEGNLQSLDASRNLLLGENCCAKTADQVKALGHLLKEAGKLTEETGSVIRSKEEEAVLRSENRVVELIAWNLRNLGWNYEVDGRGESQYDKIFEYLKDMDVVVVLECKYWQEQQKNHATPLFQKMRMSGFVMCASDLMTCDPDEPKGGEYGLIWYREDKLKLWHRENRGDHYFLPEGSKANEISIGDRCFFKRNPYCVHLAFKDDPKVSFTVVAVHLDCASEAYRRLELQSLAAALKPADWVMPVIICGDFNFSGAGEHNNALEKWNFRTGLKFQSVNERCAFTNAANSKPLDHIWLDERVICISKDVCVGPDDLGSLSDHKFIKASIKF